MFPRADVPIAQLSLDATRQPAEHYAIGAKLSPLRDLGVLVVGSGNMVHNLRMVALRGEGVRDFDRPFGFDWAIEANELLKQLVRRARHAELADYASLGPAVQLAVPTPEHYLPMLYVLALRREGEEIRFFNDVALAGSLTMTSFVVG
jgi:4,5-DOPA dioxygenase extradiol